MRFSAKLGLLILLLLTSQTASSQDLTFFLPLELDPTTFENASQLQLVGMFGRGTIEKLVWSPDNQQIAVAGSVGIWIYDADDLNREPIWLNSHTSIVHDIAFSSDGTLLASAGDDGTMRLWDTDTWEELDDYCFVAYATEGECSPATGVSFSDDGLLLAIAINDHIVIWDTESSEESFRLFEDEVFQIEFAPLSHLLVSSGKTWRNTLNVWNLDDFSSTSQEDAQPYREFRDFPFPVWDFAISDDGRQIVVVGFSDMDGGAILDIESGERVATLPASFGGVIEINPSNQLLTSPGFKYDQENDVATPTIRIADNQTFETVKTYDLPGFPNTIAYDSTGSRIAVGTAEGSLYLFDEETAALLSSVTGHGSYHWDVAFNDDDNLLADVEGNSVWMSTLAGGGAAGGNTVHVWQLSTGEEIAGYDAHSIDFNDQINIIEFIPFNNDLLWGSAEIHNLFRWSLSGAPTQVFPFTQELTELSEIVVSPNGVLVGISSHSSTGFYLFLAPVSDNSLPAHLANTDQWHEGINALAFSPDSELMASGTRNGQVVVWNTNTLGQVDSIRLPASITDMAFTPDGESLTISGNNVNSGASSFYTWNLTDDEPSRVVSTEGFAIGEFALSQDGRFAVATGDHGTFAFWDLSGEREPIVIQAHSVDISAIVLNHAGTLIATSSFDGTIRLWGIPSIGE